MEHQWPFAGLIRPDLLHHAAGNDVHGQSTPAERAAMQLAKNKVPELPREPIA